MDHMNISFPNRRAEPLHCAISWSTMRKQWHPLFIVCMMYSQFTRQHTQNAKLYKLSFLGTQICLSLLIKYVQMPCWHSESLWGSKQQPTLSKIATKCSQRLQDLHSILSRTVFSPEPSCLCHLHNSIATNFHHLPRCHLHLALEFRHKHVQFHVNQLEI